MTIKNPSDIVFNHFKIWSDVDHINFKAFLLIVQMLGGKSAVILETGTSAWGTDSTRLWDRYIRIFGGSLTSVDIREEPSQRLKNQLSEKSILVVSDSVKFLKETYKDRANVYYLDSFDLDLNDPIPAALHGLKEYLAFRGSLEDGALIFIDDTPNKEWFDQLPIIPKHSISFLKKYGVYPGKGSLVLSEIQKDFHYEILLHEYAILIKIGGRKRLVIE